METSVLSTLPNHKRIRRSPTKFAYDKLIYIKKTKKVGKKPKVEETRYDYEYIPIPSKYENSDNITLLYGSIPVMQVESLLYTDFSLLNEFYLYQDIHTFNRNGQRVILIETIKRDQTRVTRWKTTSKKLIKSKEKDYKKWGYLLRDFSLNYHKKINHYFKKYLKDTLKSEFKSNSDLKTEDGFTVSKCEDLESPYVQLKTRFTGHQSHLQQIIINEKFLQVFGYNIEFFVATILIEGIPNLFPMFGSINSHFLHNLLEHYVKTNDYELCTQSLKCELMTKSGCLRKANIQVKFSVDPSKKDQEVDTFFTITEAGDSYFSPDEALTPKINQNFIDLITDKESQMMEFVKKYYNYEIFPKYYNFDKFCRIKELRKADTTDVDVSHIKVNEEELDNYTSLFKY